MPLPIDHPLIAPPTAANIPSHDLPHSSHTAFAESIPQRTIFGSLRRPKPHNSLDYGGPGYENLPSHQEDIHRLINESTAAKETAHLLQDALVFTRPDELASKPVINEFYRKCFLAHESLTNQIDWAQAEAAQSQERAATMEFEQTGEVDPEHHEVTMEERALAVLFEAHAMLADALRQHDELERLAGEEKVMREVRERSKKDTKMDRSVCHVPILSSADEQAVVDHAGALFAPDTQASSSRSPSPAPHKTLPPPSAPPFVPPGGQTQFLAVQSRSRTPSPEGKTRHAEGTRLTSPLGRAAGPRPLPQPNDTNHKPTVQPDVATALVNGDAVDDPDQAPKQPSRKALGKRRANIDEESEPGRSPITVVADAKTPSIPTSCSSRTLQSPLRPYQTIRWRNTKCSLRDRSNTHMTHIRNRRKLGAQRTIRALRAWWGLRLIREAARRVLLREGEVGVDLRGG